MAKMTFYNPAALLASPDVAVKAPPVGDNMAVTAIAAGMAAIKDNLRKKQEVDSLVKNTEAMASYMDTKSPELAQLLRSKVETYKPTAFNGYDAINVQKEKDSLLKGVVDLYGMELDEQKALASGSSLSLQNNYGAQLRAAESQSNNLNNNWNTWEANENKRQQEYEENRIRLATEGKADGIPKFQRQENPYTAQKDAADRKYNELMNSTPEQIASKATPSRMSNRGSSVIPSAINPPVPSGGVRTPMTQAEVKADQDRAMDPEIDLPDTPGAPNGTLLDVGSPLSGPATDSQSTDPHRPAADLPMPELTPQQRAAAMTGSNSGEVGREVIPPISSAPVSDDPVMRINETAKSRRAANVKTMEASVNQLQQALEREKKTYLNKEAVNQVIEEGNRVKEDISSLPDPGSDEWNRQAKEIYRSYRQSMTMLQRNTVAGEKLEGAVDSQEQQQYYVAGSVDKAPITVYKRDIDGMPRFFINEGGKSVEVTNQIGTTFLPITQSTETNVTKPAGQIKTLKDLLK